MARRLIRLKPGFDVALARQGYSVRSFARFAGMAHQTLFALIHPEHQARYRSLGGMHLRTAWRLGHAYAKVVGLSEEHAYAAIVSEEQVTPAATPASQVHHG